MSFDSAPELNNDWQESTQEMPGYVALVYGVAVPSGEENGVESVPISTKEAYKIGIAERIM